MKWYGLRHTGSDTTHVYAISANSPAEADEIWVVYVKMREDTFKQDKADGDYDEWYTWEMYYGDELESSGHNMDGHEDCDNSITTEGDEYIWTQCGKRVVPTDIGVQTVWWDGEVYTYKDSCLSEVRTIMKYE